MSMLRRNPMYSPFLDLLLANCECPGQAIHRNQLLVAECLLKNDENRGLLLGLRKRVAMDRPGRRDSVRADGSLELRVPPGAQLYGPL